MNAVWAGVIGSVAGGFFVSATALLSPLVTWKTESKKLAAEHAHQTEEASRDYKRTLVASWRAGLADSKKRYWEWQRSEDDGHMPEVVGMAWFESLRPHLSPELLGTIGVGHLYDSNTHELSIRIGELEREWKLI